MLKTISVEQVRVGMFIQALKGAWVHHPFWKKSFLLDDNKDLHKLQSSAVQYVVIDTGKGVDVLEDAEAVETECETIVTTHPINIVPEVEKSIERISAQQEQTEAKRIIKESKQAVASMFNDLRLGKAINSETVMPLVDEISASITRNQGALISLVRLKTQDDYTYMHSVAVCALMTSLAKQLELSETEVKQAGLAGLLHDVGKSQVPLLILNKPAALSDDEFNLIKQHPSLGYELLQQGLIDDAVALDVCLHHHEKIDGSGYPHQLKDSDISIYAKMGAVCDVYDAVTSNRPYKAGWEPGISLKRMAQWTNHFDQTVFKAFVKSVGIYPIGTIVLLKSARLAVIIDQSEKSLLKPIVKVFFSTQSKSIIPTEIIDLSTDEADDEIVGEESAATWGIFNTHQLWTEQ